MKKTLLTIALAVSGLAFAQEGKLFWKATPERSGILTFKDRETLPSKHLYNLDIPGLRAALADAPLRGTVKSPVIVLFPNANGELERFRVVEAPVMDSGLAARYPEIRSYAGQGVDNPSAIIRFSLSPLGLQTMMSSADRPAVFIEPYSTDLKTYTVYERAQKSLPFT